MTPRNTQLGASATARRTPAKRGSAAASSTVASSTKPRRTPIRAAAPKKAAPKTPKSPTRDASWWRWWLLPIIVVATVALFVASYYPVAKVQYRETRERARLQAEYDALSSRNARLRTQVARLKTPEGVEDYARSQLGMVKQGEHVVVVLDGTTPKAALASTMTKTPQLDTGETSQTPSGPWTAFLDSVFQTQ